MSFAMPPFVKYGPHEVSTRTEIGKHLWEHEQPNYNPKDHPYPKMLYKAYKGEDGVVRCMDGMPKPFMYANQEMYRMALEAAEHFNLSCQKTVGVKDDGSPAPELGPAQQRAAEEEGWRTSPKAAMEFVFSLQKAISKAAEERAYDDRHLSEKARAEVAAAEAETTDQLPEIAEKPIVKRGRPRKNPEAA